MCQSLLLEFFENGLPLRGSISLGDSYIDERKGIFAGCSFIEAHDFEHVQDWSSCGLASSAETFVRQILKENPNLFWKVLIEHRVPLKKMNTAMESLSIGPIHGVGSKIN